VVKLFRGKVTGRLLAKREPFTWQGEKASERLCRQILIRTCKQVLREHYRRWQDISLDPNPHMEEQRGAAYSARLIGSISEGETLLLQVAAVLEFVEGLAQFAEQLRHKHREALSETIEALLLYVKVKAAQMHPVYAQCSMETLRSVRIERLLQHSTLCALDVGKKEELWHFVEQTLQLNRAGVHQRKRQLCLQVQRLPVPDSLRPVLGLLCYKICANGWRIAKKTPGA